jgi:hypothetical protein
MPLQRPDVRAAKRQAIRRLPAGLKALVAVGSLGLLGNHARKTVEEREQPKGRRFDSALTARLVDLQARIAAKTDV